MPNGQNEEKRRIEARELKTASDFSVYKQLAQVLPPFRDEPVCSRLFIVEGSLEHPRVGIRYPGRKLKQRILKRPNKNSALYANLLDFEAVPFNKGREDPSSSFTYMILLEDFSNFKRQSDEFWQAIVRLYERNVITDSPSVLKGIDSQQFLEMLKWMWIQEDLNYKLSWNETSSSIKYISETRTGTTTRNGAGRAKFFAMLVLAREGHFETSIIIKIISPRT